MNKRYTVRYYINDKPVKTAVGNWAELKDLLNGDAKESFIETKISENMPTTMHNTISKHNESLMTKNS
jgi:hypothetical protein